MQLPPDQIDQIKSALHEGRRRVSVSLTDVQRQLWLHEAAAEDQGCDDTVARVHRIREAAIRPGFFGDLRRAIAAARIPDARLASFFKSMSRCWSDFVRARRNSQPTRSND